MNCLKCGRETAEGQVFCKECLAVMEKYPVKPGTAVLLPKREPAPTVKKVRWKPAPTREEQVTKLRRQNHRLIAVLCVVAVLLCVGGYFTGRYLLERRAPRPGQNYSTVETIAATSPD